VKVLLSALACGPDEGSEPGTGWYWATALANIGHDVTVLTMSGHREAILKAGRPDIHFKFIDIPATPLPHLAGRLWTYDIYRRWQQDALRFVASTSRDFDVVHHVTWTSLHLGSMLWQLSLPMVYGPIGGGQTAPADYWRYFGRDWPAELVRTATTRPLLTLNARSRETIRHSDVTLVCNSATAAACRRLGGRDVRYMMSDALRPDWVVAPRSRPAGPPVVLFVGRLLPRKAPTLAVQAFAELRRAMPARMIMAGDGPLRGKVRETIERLGVGADVDMLGQVSWEQVRALYDSASVLLFTSLRESFGAQFLEALGRGLPAVALDHHGIGDADVGAAAVKVPLTPAPRDLPRQLAAGLGTILSDGQWERRSAAAVSFASNQLWTARAAAATDIYTEVLSRHKQREALRPGSGPAGRTTRP
jgi:glycosyltransferase involved in cell wall biosynthesis